MPESLTVTVSDRGAARWVRGHSWIFRSDVVDPPRAAGLARVSDSHGRFLGQALCSPRSEITLRLLERSERPIDAGWWREKIHEAAGRRTGIDATAWRVIHGEGDAMPSLIVDRYDRWLVAQMLSAGLDLFQDDIVAALIAELAPEGILLRNDVAVRRLEAVPEEVRLVFGQVPQEIEIREGSIRYLASPWTGQKTGAFLDQRPNRVLAATLVPAGGEALDCFAYHGSFALHLAARAGRVIAQDSSADALVRGAANARLNGFANIEWLEGDAFQVLRDFEHRRHRFDTVVLDPPAFAKSRASVPEALRGYKEINLRALRLLKPGGHLLTASCSFHVRRPEFLKVIAEAAADSGRRTRLVELIGQGVDHPEILTIPETGYLKGAVLQAL
ncbi:MAG TPA: class I SAM-dependent rRNA methyltransferase [Gemmatimonadales bacterium]|jgi:23S rRNA (cytosine1962-C5)-methyltransferase|nr:class I SAM-dependent rRNA methyltransferase [Gemmatimonadales bacterium]